MEKVQHFSNKGQQGYDLAKARLAKAYGRPCIIADVCECQLKEFPSVKANNPEALKRFSELLERVLTTLDDINYLGSLNSLDNMAQLVN